MKSSLVIATRGSRLALWQAEHIREKLLAIRPDLEITLLKVQTQGDVILDVPLAKIGGKGLFLKEIEEALLRGEADLAVHSLKDMPAELPESLILAAVPQRENPADCLISNTNFASLKVLPEKAVVGTCSLRRQAQILHLRPDLQIKMLRGNLETRLRKLAEAEFDAIILANAGIKRLQIDCAAEDKHLLVLPHDQILPAVGQAALGIECRADDHELQALLAKIEHQPSRICVNAERAFLAKLGGGCQTPVAAHAYIRDRTLVIQGLVANINGSTILRHNIRGTQEQAEEMGSYLAKHLLERGADKILAELANNS